MVHADMDKDLNSKLMNNIDSSPFRLNDQEREASSELSSPNSHRFYLTPRKGNTRNDDDIDSIYDSVAEQDSSLVDDILSSRKVSLRQMNRKLSMSSPTHGGVRQGMQKSQNQLKQDSRRNKIRERRQVSNRGGIESMEKFIMESERSHELEQLKQIAQENVVSETFLEDIERESKEDESDDELIELLQSQGHWEQELEYLLKDLSIT
ncbi:hypothetical protein Kpol_1018p99 [Vanderwaltozyma polyspora DSM 70294]|uniref:Uncharacterized protein n=1 Tax=Vanderwaltozyma polyspora (strain ATCC 22028 / DSM 70294 / BCRC 21397 / CBS 2163 / NBRC 10782 / NRRL Y-8283 / UCD 57-17) TaxID=436907 RepID=A7TDU6_VANPO|nr:uncharacterized protein Kpol_1018p99 [Vanderwaltozyma polyspora DSM 70294]EDO19566.1 hypothetical protein Kpol_1018p99 [Vanderwaltozyma polyspora DSM 70294]